MLKRILVPTDGSEESEKALALAEQVAKAQGAEILLVRVVERLVWPGLGAADEAPPDLYHELLAQMEEDARKDLARLAARLQADGTAASVLVLHGSAAGALLDCVDDQCPDLVAMATHGRSGLERFTLGSVTDRMVREGSAPVLVLRKSSTPTAKLEHALVTLDGSGVAEEALPIVYALAGKPLRRVTLLRAVAEPGERGAAATYLEGVAARLSAEGLETRTRVELGWPRAVIEGAAQEVDLVILCTHGRSGFDRLRHGSVAEHVMREVDRPALIVRAGSGSGSR